MRSTIYIGNPRAVNQEHREMFFSTAFAGQSFLSTLPYSNKISRHIVFVDSSRAEKIKLTKCFPQKSFAHQIFPHLCVSCFEVAVERYLEIIYASALIRSLGVRSQKQYRRPPWPSRLTRR